jgi:hypothetical protein
MINQIGLHTEIAGEKVREKLLGELWLTMEQILHHRLIDANNSAGFK